MTDGAKRLILFTLSGEIYALSLADVAEVLEPPPLSPIPRVPPFFSGVMNFHGNLVSVIDMAGFLMGAPHNRKGQLLVLDNRIATLALWVDSVESVRPTDVVLEERGSDEEFVEKVVMISDREVKMLSLERLLGKLEGILVDTGRNGER